MLKEIQCDKFISNGKIRPAIKFHEGLNTILGNASGANSIGKSTFLMIIDFVFGGVDYIERSTDIQLNVGIHTINFKFEFDGRQYYFSRSTGDYTLVNKCNDKYEAVSSMPLEKYTNFLAKKYSLELEGLTFRGAVSRYIRVYKRENLDESLPLNTYKKETGKNAIKGLLQLFDKYASVMHQSHIAELARDKENTFKSSQKYNFIACAKNKTVYKNNEKRISELKEQAEQLAAKSSQGLLELDSFQAEQLSALKHKYSGFKRQRTRLYSQLKSIRSDKDYGKKSYQSGYEELEQFFPCVNTQRLKNIENFHRQLSSILSKEFKENEKNIQDMISLIDNEISSIEERIKQINSTPNISKAALDKYSEINRELTELTEANKNFDEISRLHSCTKTLEEGLNHLILENISALQTNINNIMAQINSFIYNGKKTAPVLTIQDSKRYSFFTPNDSGTGSQYKGLIVFDLASLEMTNLPFIVHDSIILKHIEDTALEKILELYSKSSKQIFIAIDKESSYTENSQKILRNSTVLRLSVGGNELFGRSWNELKK